MDYIVYKLPNHTPIYTLEPSEDKETISFFNFDGEKKTGFKGIPKEITIEQLKNQTIPTESLETHNSEVLFDKANYIDTIREVMDFINAKDIKKLVISRQKYFEVEVSSLDLIETFLKLSEIYPSAFVYLFIKDTVCWIGATPEILGKYNAENEVFETMSLAGTLPLEQEWSTKEIEEQKPVTEYIQQTLEQVASSVLVSETYSTTSGNIKHLRNDFKAQLSADQLPSLIKTLHPTPAVCGIPKVLCKEAIQQFEPHERSLYSGYIQIQHHDKQYFFVNLRCAEVFRNRILAYVGGGITAMSDPEKEWVETELKSQAIGNHLVLR